MKFIAASLSESGPRHVNEDFVGLWPQTDSLVAAIADGLGGMGGGAEASRFAIEYLGAFVRNDGLSSEELYKVASSVHEGILELQKENVALKSMATTLSAISLVGSTLYGVHCGDTRIAIARGNGIKRLSNDHSEGMRLFEAGKLTKEELRDYPRKHILYSALGGHKPPIIQALEFSLQVGDRIVITSDGVHQKVALRELRDTVMADNDPTKCIERIRATVLKRGPEDNFSAVAVFVVA